MDQNMQENGMMVNNMDQGLWLMRKERNTEVDGIMVRYWNGLLKRIDRLFN